MAHVDLDQSVTLFWQEPDGQWHEADFPTAHAAAENWIKVLVRRGVSHHTVEAQQGDERLNADELSLVYRTGSPERPADGSSSSSAQPRE